MIWIRHCLVACLAMLMAGIVMTVLAIGVVTVLLQRGPLDLPQLQSLVENRLNTQLSDQNVQIGAVALLSDTEGVGNKVRLTNVSVIGENGQHLLSVPEIRTSFSLLELVQGTIAPEDIAIVGTELSLERAEDGSISLFGLGGAVGGGFNVLKLLDNIGARNELAALKRIDLSDTKIVFHDQKTDRAWVLDNSELVITREGDTLSGRAVMEMGADEALETSTATMLLSGRYDLGSSNSSVSFQFADAAPAEIADLFEAFDWLRNLETKLSGSVRSELTSEGQLGNLHGVLEMGKGRLAQTPASQPIEFSTAKVYFDYDTKSDALNLGAINLETSSGSVSASGYAELARNENGSVSSMAGQLRLSDLTINRPDLFEKDITIPAAALDARLSFAPLKIEVGRLTVFDEGSVIKISGQSVAGKEFWQNKYDLDIDKMTVARLKEVWPKPVVHKTREWMYENAFGGEFVGFSGGFRTQKGIPEFAFNFGFNKAHFNFVDTLPYMNDADGYGYFTHKDIRLDLIAGHVIAPDNTRVDAAGTSLFIPDIETRPTPGEITLHAKGGLHAALQLLNADKFKFLDKVGLDTDVAEGAVSVAGTFKLPLSKDADTKDMKIDLTAELFNVRSEKLIKKRTLSARRLVAKVTEDQVELTGDAQLDGIPLNATWEQSFDKSSDQPSRLQVALTLNDKNLRAFGIDLPKGSIAGETSAAMNVGLKKGVTPTFEVSSNLVGATLRIPALGWAKSRNARGAFRMAGRFGDSVSVDRLELAAAGLDVKGALDLNNEGVLQRARLTTVNVGRWLSTSAVLTPKGGGNVDISVNGGSADLRFLGENDSGTTSGSGGTNIKMALDSVRVTNDLALTNFVGQLNTKKGLRGKIVGRVNGGTRIDGQLFPQKFGTALELTSKDAGGVMASAGLLKNARGGEMRVILVPRAGKGNYDGTLDVKRTRIKDASAMAGLLNAISLVGAIQQLEGEGIHFSNVEGQFKLRDEGVKLENISAVGPSIGMTLDGWYNTKTKAVDFEGVLTPLYAVNGVFERIFGQLVGRRKGEGMFSFTYRMRGLAADPKIGVNPLSILTPGAFREIFRQKAPQRPSQ